jgi:hypothetical protein
MKRKKTKQMILFVRPQMKLDECNEKQFVSARHFGASKVILRVNQRDQSQQDGGFVYKKRPNKTRACLIERTSGSNGGSRNYQTIAVFAQQDRKSMRALSISPSSLEKTNHIRNRSAIGSVGGCVCALQVCRRTQSKRDAANPLGQITFPY